MIHLSQNALRELRRLQSQSPLGERVVRLTIQPGGCAGWCYDLRLEPLPRNPTPTLMTWEGVKLWVDGETLSRCEGMTVDYAEDLMGGNFRFTNPLAHQTCGCGVSFSLADDRSDQPPGEDCTTAAPGLSHG